MAWGWWLNWSSLPFVHLDALPYPKSNKSNIMSLNYLNGIVSLWVHDPKLLLGNISWQLIRCRYEEFVQRTAYATVPRIRSWCSSKKPRPILTIGHREVADQNGRECWFISRTIVLRDRISLKLWYIFGYPDKVYKEIFGSNCFTIILNALSLFFFPIH